MKPCRTCGEVKSLDEYYGTSGTKDGKAGSCKVCAKERTKRNYRERKATEQPKPKKPRMQGFRKLPEGIRKCSRCEDEKPKELFYVDNRRASGTSSYCKSCTTELSKERRKRLGEKALETRRKWAEDNRERLRKQDKAYRENNRDKKRLSEARRRARKISLPDTLTLEQTNEILEHFGGNCALCDQPSEALDHFIPIASGHGGTTKENIIPLCQKMNTSKLARNPFLWAEDTLDESGKRRFEGAVKYLADLNELTIAEYRDFVFSCFKNKTNKNIS